MCELFSGDFGTLHTDHPHFTFVDADNARKGFERSLRSRGFNDEEMERFSMERVFDYLNSNRNYLFSAIASQSDPPEWIKKLRGLEGFVFREGLLTQRQDGKLQQKGVDVLLAVEAMKLSSRRKVGSITIFSSDGVPRPADVAIRSRIPVELWAPTCQPSARKRIGNTC